MRVVDITQWYSPTSGGIRTYLHAKAAWAGREGHGHAAIVTGPASGGAVVHRSPFLAVGGWTPSARWGYRIAATARPVLAALTRLEPSVVVIHDALAFPRAVARWAAGRGVPLAMVCHSDLAQGAAALPLGMRAPVTAVLGAVQRRAYRAPAVILVASEGSRERVASHAPGRVVLSPLGVDPVFAAARPDPALRARLVGGRGRLLLYAGRLSSEKRVDALPGVLAALDGDDVLVLAGTGASEHRLRRDAARRGVGDRVVLLGHVGDRCDLAALMATADCFVHPNPDEPFGLAPLEALAAGCRVVAPRSVGNAPALERGGAVLVASGATAALAAGVREAMAAPPPARRPDPPDWDDTFTREWDLYRMLAVAA